MLVKKVSDNSSAAVVPLTTAYAMFKDNAAFNGEATMSLQPIVTKNNIFYPGNNALVMGEHQTYNTATQDFSGINQAIGSNAYVGSTTVVGSWGKNPTLGPYLTANHWIAGFNRFNWLEYSDNPDNESANYNGTEYGNAICYMAPERFEEEYDVWITNNTYIYMDWQINAAQKNQLYGWPLRWGEPNAFTLIFDGAGYFEEGNKYYVTGTAINNRMQPGAVGYSAYFISQVTPDFRTYDEYHTTFTRNYRNCARTDTPSPDPWGGTGPALKFETSERLYTSGVTAFCEFYGCYTAFDITGNNLQFTTDMTGTVVTGVVSNGSDTVNVEAFVDYAHEVNGVIDYNVTDYVWDNVSSTEVNDAGGGGGYSAEITVHTPFANKKLTNIDNTIVTPYDATCKSFTLSSKHNIPSYYGGAMLFSGNNIGQYFNNSDKFYCIGLKGVSLTPGYSQEESVIYSNYCGKFYKFDDKHFTKINNDVFEFHDDQIGNIYSCYERDETSGSSVKRLSQIGPMFLSFDGFTYKNDNHGQMYKTFEINELSSFEIPTVLNTINYIKSFDPEKELDPRYVIAKPTSAIVYENTFGYDKNHGNTDTYSYLVTYFPKYSLASSPLKFNKNITEITNLGESCTAFTGIYSMNGDLTELTAVKSDWSHCNNVVNIVSLFANATKLKEIPDSWEGLDSVTGAQGTFSRCTSLSSIPDSWEGLGSLNDASNMFSNCTSISSIPLSLNGLTNLRSAPGMFEYCKSLTDIFDSWEGLQDGVSIPSMFQYCYSLTGIPTTWVGLGNYYMPSIFRGCSSLQTIPDSWEGLNVGEMAYMFADCGLTAVPDSWSGLSNVIRTDSTFSGCTALSSIPDDLIEKCPVLTDMENMFNGCTALTSDIKHIMDAGNARMQNLVFGSAFMGCINVQNYNTLTADDNYKPWFGIPTT